jgi:hypothetical protein
MRTKARHTKHRLLPPPATEPGRCPNCGAKPWLSEGWLPTTRRHVEPTKPWDVLEMGRPPPPPPPPPRQVRDSFGHLEAATLAVVIVLLSLVTGYYIGVGHG